MRARTVFLYLALARFLAFSSVMEESQLGAERTVDLNYRKKKSQIWEVEGEDVACFGCFRAGAKVCKVCCVYIGHVEGWLKML